MNNLAVKSQIKLSKKYSELQEVINSSNFSVAEISINYSTKVKSSELIQITSSKDAIDILRPYYENSMELRESSYMLTLSRANKVTGIYQVSVGSRAGTLMDVTLIMQAAILANSCGYIISHSHPSGQLKPSAMDIDITKRLKEAGKLLEIPLLDHLILTTEGYFSFADECLL